MFDCRFPLLEVIKALEGLHGSRGATNVQVCNFIRNRARDKNNPMKVLKTIRCLNKLVEEGVLCKKGRRYIFSSKKGSKRRNLDPNDKEDDDDEEEEDEDDENDEEREGEGLRNSRNNCCDDDDEEEEEEDQDKEEEDDDDDDDDDEDDDDDGEEYVECNEKDNIESESKTAQSQDNYREDSRANNSKKSPITSSADSNNNFSKSSKNEEGMNNPPIYKNNAKKHPGRRGGHKPRNKNRKKHSGYSGKNSRKKSRRNNGGLYLAPDLPYQSVFSQGMSAIKEENLCEMQASPNLELRKIYQARRKDSKSKRSHTRNNYRSRSPIPGNKNMHQNLKLERTEDLGLYNDQMFQEVTEGDLEIAIKNDNNNNKESCGDLSNCASTPEVPITGTPGTIENIKEPSIEKAKKTFEKIKMEPGYECDTKFAIKRNVESRNSLKVKENQSKKSQKDGDRTREKHKREFSADNDRSDSEKRAMSLCSTCEKKKRSS